MTEVSTRVNDDGTTEESARCQRAVAPANIESYETDEGVVFYDAENPLAWVETTHPILLEDRV